MTTERDNQSRAREVLGDISPFLHWQAVDVARVRDALDAAEARGRSEVAAKVEALADVVEQGRAWTGDSLARRLRALAAEATQVHRYDPETGRCTCGALDHPDWGVTA